MTNEEVKRGFNEIYNHFWKRYKDKVPDKDSEEWDRMYDMMKELQRLYPFMSAILREMVIEFDERMRKNERP